MINQIPASSSSLSALLLVVLGICLGCQPSRMQHTPAVRSNSTPERGAHYYYTKGQRYIDGDGVESDSSRALTSFRKAAQLGHPQAQLLLGQMYESGKRIPQNYFEAAQWYRRAATSGNPVAQNNLGGLYDRGLGVSRDPIEAVQWYRKSAEKGYAPAQSNLGVAYATGTGVTRNYATAALWFRKAADQGDADSQSNLATLYTKGWGVEQSDAQAFHWFLRAAEQGSAEGQAQLGVIYAQGRGAPQDRSLAEHWLRKATSQGHPIAEKNLNRLRSSSHGRIADSATEITGLFGFQFGAQCPPGRTYSNLTLVTPPEALLELKVLSDKDPLTLVNYYVKPNSHGHISKIVLTFRTESKAQVLKAIDVVRNYLRNEYPKISEQVVFDTTRGISTWRPPGGAQTIDEHGRVTLTSVVKSNSFQILSLMRSPHINENRPNAAQPSHLQFTVDEESGEYSLRIDCFDGTIESQF